VLDAQGCRTQVGVIGLPNEASARFHESFGFRHAGTLTGVGHKLGSWRDVGFWQRTPDASDGPPPVLRPFAEAWREVAARRD
jgi:phosphinothricin acetyltransferase